jgi:hypothetical protein
MEKPVPMMGNIVIDSVSEVFGKIPTWFTLCNTVRRDLHYFFNAFVNVFSHGLISFTVLNRFGANESVEKVLLKVLPFPRGADF